MSLAMFAAPFDDEPSSNVYMNNESSIQKKKISKTLKRYPPIGGNTSHSQDNIQKKVDFQKVNQVMRAMSNLPSNDDEMGDFNPPPPPMSSGVQSTIMRENMASINEQDMNMPHVPQQSTAVSSSNSGILNIPNYDNIYNNTPYNTPSHSSSSSSSSMTNDQNVLMDKLNYMIHLLEEQQDERTGSVMEEVILYSFLGVFIIFIVDSFCHVGKYTR